MERHCFVILIIYRTNCTSVKYNRSKFYST